MHDRLFKIRPFIQKLKDTFTESFIPHRNISVDESTVCLKSRSAMNLIPTINLKNNYKLSSHAFYVYQW